MKKKILLSMFVVLMLSFGIYQKFYTCSSNSRASTDLLARVCTNATLTYSNKYEQLENEQKVVAEKAKQARVIRDERVAKINEAIKKDLVFRGGQK